MRLHNLREGDSGYVSQSAFKLDLGGKWWIPKGTLVRDEYGGTATILVVKYIDKVEAWKEAATNLTREPQDLRSESLNLTPVEWI